MTRGNIVAVVTAFVCIYISFFLCILQRCFLASGLTWSSRRQLADRRTFPGGQGGPIESRDKSLPSYLRS